MQHAVAAITDEHHLPDAHCDQIPPGHGQGADSDSASYGLGGHPSSGLLTEPVFGREVV